MPSYEDLAVKAASQGAWRTAIQFAMAGPQAFDKLPQYGIPDHAMTEILDYVERKPWLKEKVLPGLLYEYSENIPKDAGPETLNRVADLGKEDSLVTENVHSHPNWAPDARTKGLMQAGTHWNNYERSVHPAHFATAKSLFTGQPETLTDHRGNTGSSEQTMALHPHLKEYAKLTQDAIMKDAREFPWNQKDHDEREEAMAKRPFSALDPRIRMKYIKGEPHIQAFRGISGNYAESIAQKANMDDLGNVDKKVLSIPTTHMTSWSIDPHIAKRFASTRAEELPGQQSKRALVLEKWIPVKDILHSGFHKVVTNQDHAHKDEFEIVAGHKNAVVKIPTKNIHVVRQTHENEPLIHHLEPAKVRESKPLKKSEYEDNQLVIQDMLGGSAELRASLDAARFLANTHIHLSYQEVRRALWEHEDTDKAALAAYGLDITEENIKAMQAVKEMLPMEKSEADIQHKHVEPFNKDAEDVAEEVQRAFQADMVEPLKLKGKHAGGSLMAQDPHTKHTWLLKPGSGGQSSAMGATEQPATQSEREAAFYHAMKEMGLENSVPRAELLLIDGKQYAAVSLLPKSYVNLERLRQSDEGRERGDLLPLLRTGLVHMWGVADYILGNPDRHANNLMVSNKSDDIKLIDHGSALAGESFNPAHDKNSFVPAYLRAWAPPVFNKLPTDQKLRYLPRISTKEAQDLVIWLDQIDAGKLSDLLLEYNVEPSAILARLNKLKDMANHYPADLAVNLAWVQ